MSFGFHPNAPLSSSVETMPVHPRAAFDTNGPVASGTPRVLRVPVLLGGNRFCLSFVRPEL